MPFTLDVRTFMTLRDPLCAIKADKPIVINRSRKCDRRVRIAYTYNSSRSLVYFAPCLITPAHFCGVNDFPAGPRIEWRLFAKWKQRFAPFETVIIAHLSPIILFFFL